MKNQMINAIKLAYYLEDIALLTDADKELDDDGDMFP